MRRIISWSKKNIFFLLFVLFIVGPLFLIYVYPRPTIVKRQKGELTKLHKERVDYIEAAIDKAKQHQQGSRVYGAGPVREEQAEMDEIHWKEQLIQEKKEYNKEMSKLEAFPLSSGEIIGLIAIYVALLGLHFHQRPK